MKNLGGTAFVKVNGKTLKIRGSLTVLPGGRTREAVTGMDGVHGMTETHVAPQITGNFTNPGKEMLDEIANATDMTITAELSNGESWVLVGAVLTNERSLDLSSGEITLEFAGDSMV